MRAPDLSPGDVLGGRYRLEAMLGEGGMGVVWRALDLTEGRAVALKLVKSAAADARRRFFREARAVAAVRHRHVVAVHEVFELEDGAPVLVMEMLDGEPLSERLARERRLSIVETAELLIPVVSAVGAAHAIGIVHRDLKPENIFLARRPGGGVEVKVVDFGIAKWTGTPDAPQTTLTASGALLGTPYFMSPEQVFGEKDVDHRADIWALGLILYRCLSGVLPTEAENMGQVLKLILSRSLPSLSTVAPEVPDDVAELVDRMLRPRGERLADLHEVRRVLARYVSLETPDFGPSAVPVAASPESDERLVVRVAGSSPGSKSGAFDATEAYSPPPAAARVRPASLVVFGLAVAAIAGAVTVGTRRLLHDEARPAHAAATPVPAPAPSPLAPADSVLACPILEVNGASAEGWLGAAAAELGCRHATWQMGGRPERAIGPADLLDLPRGPTSDFPPDPFDSPGARERSILAARRRGQAYLDGSVQTDGKSYSVALTLRAAASGAAVSDAKGAGPNLWTAMDAATNELAASRAIPAVATPLPEVAAWGSARTIEAVWLIDQVSRRLVSPAVACPRFFSRREDLGPMVYLVARLCQETHPTWLPGLPAPQLDRSSVGLLARTAMDLAIWDPKVPPPDVVPELTRAAETEPSATGKTVLHAASAVLSSIKGESETSATQTLAALAAAPEERDLWSPVVLASPFRAAAAAAWTAWTPSDAEAWSRRAEIAGLELPEKIRMIRRAVALQGVDDYRLFLARTLLTSGSSAEVTSLAASFGDDTDDHRMATAYLRARVDAGEGRLDHAFETLRDALLHSDPTLTGPVKSPAISFLLALGRVLGRQTDWADAAARHFIVDLKGREPDLWGSEWLHVMVCLDASRPVARACADRVEALGRGKELLWPYGSRPFLEGTKRYARGDLRGAVKAWREVLAGAGMLSKFLPVEAFDETGERDLGDAIDRAVLEDKYLRGISAAHPRAARRAYAAGDRARAHELAVKVVEAWELADVKLPVVDEMRSLARKTAH